MSIIKTALATGTALVAALTVAACSSSKSSGGPTASTAASAAASQTPAPPASTPPATGAAASSPAAAASLTGKWIGSYSGSFSGTFTLDWTQRGPALTGTIDLSTSGKTSLSGTVVNGKIHFGTVGSTVITYTGTVSGNSLSGDYQIAGGAGGQGTWKAQRA